MARTAATVVRFGELDPTRSWNREGSGEGSQEDNTTMPRNAGTYRILNLLLGPRATARARFAESS